MLDLFQSKRSRGNSHLKPTISSVPLPHKYRKWVPREMASYDRARHCLICTCIRPVCGMCEGFVWCPVSHTLPEKTTLCMDRLQHSWTVLFARKSRHWTSCFGIFFGCSLPALDWVGREPGIRSVNTTIQSLSSESAAPVYSWFSGDLRNSVKSCIFEVPFGYGMHKSFMDPISEGGKGVNTGFTRSYTYRASSLFGQHVLWNNREGGVAICEDWRGCCGYLVVVLQNSGSIKKKKNTHGSAITRFPQILRLTKAPPFHIPQILCSITTNLYENHHLTVIPT